MFDVLIEDGLIRKVGKDLPVDGAEVYEVPRGRDRRARSDRHPRAPARTGPGAQGNGRDRHGFGGRRRLHRGRVHAEHRRRSTTMPASRSSSSRRRPKRGWRASTRSAPCRSGQKGDQLAELGEQKAAGCVAFTDDGHPVATALLMRRALEYAGMLGVPIIDHCEDPSLKGDGVAHEGYYASALGPARHPRRRRIADGRARRLARRADRRARAHRAHERAAVDPRRPLRARSAASA